MNKWKKEYLGLESIGFMLQFLKGHRFGFWIGTALMASFTFLQNVFTGQLYRVVTTLGQSSSAFARQLLFVFGLLLLVVSAAGMGRWLVTRTTACADLALRRKMAEKMSHMPMESWYKQHSGQWLTMLGKDAENATKVYKQQIQRIGSLFIAVAGGIILLAIQAPALLLYAMVSGIFYFGVGLVSRKRNKENAEGNQQATAQAASYLADILSGFLVMRLYHLLQFFMKKQHEAIDEGFAYGKKIARVQIGNGALWQIGYTLAYSGALIVGLLLVYQGRLELSAMMALWPISMGVSFSIMEFGFVVTEMQPIVVAVNRIQNVFELPEETGGQQTKVQKQEPVLELKNVTFAYEPGRTVLDQVNIQIYSGEKVAFVGESGSGKSTFVKLLLRFYEPQRGEVLLYGVPVGIYALETLRNQFAYVPQNAYLLSGTIEQNIAMVRPEAVQQQVINAAKNAYADEFIRELPEGYQTQTGERGMQLSGGQRQRIAIARAFLKDAPIMVFDEITAALDGEAEAKVQQAVDATPQGKTLLMITHRLSAAVSAGRIIVMDHGKIVEMGTHQQLLEKNGKYARLWRIQFQK